MFLLDFFERFIKSVASNRHPNRRFLVVTPIEVTLFVPEGFCLLKISPRHHLAKSLRSILRHKWRQIEADSEESFLKQALQEHDSMMFFGGLKKYLETSKILQSKHPALLALSTKTNKQHVGRRTRPELPVTGLSCFQTEPRGGIAKLLLELAPQWPELASLRNSKGSLLRIKRLGSWGTFKDKAFCYNFLYLPLVGQLHGSFVPISDQDTVALT